MQKINLVVAYSEDKIAICKQNIHDFNFDL